MSGRIDSSIVGEDSGAMTQSIFFETLNARMSTEDPKVRTARRAQQHMQRHTLRHAQRHTQRHRQRTGLLQRVQGEGHCRGGGGAKM